MMGKSTRRTPFGMTTLSIAAICAVLALSSFESMTTLEDSVGFHSAPCTPLLVHIAQANDVDVRSGTVSMTVSFALDPNMCQLVSPSVTFGRENESQAEGSSADVELTSFEFESAWHVKYSSNFIYHARLEGLKAGSRKYWYRIDVGLSREGTSAVSDTGAVRKMYMRTPPLPGSPVALALLGDMGTQTSAVETARHIINATHDEARPYPISGVVVAGDLSYANGNMKVWETWLKIMEPIASLVPLSTAAGNHEIECDWKTLDIFVAYEHYFRNPNRIAPGKTQPVDRDYKNKLPLRSCIHPAQFLGHYNYGNSFYAYVHGLATIVVLNSYTETYVGSVQYNWLEKTLSSVDRTITPWILLVYHCPLRTTFKSHYNELNANNMLASMEPLFVKYGVNLAISGHDHGYQRTKPMIGGRLDPSGSGPVYLVLGTGGGALTHQYVHRDPEDWIAVRNHDQFGYGRLFFANASHAHLQWVQDGATRPGFEDDVWFFNKYADGTPS